MARALKTQRININPSDGRHSLILIAAINCRTAGNILKIERYFIVGGKCN